MQHELSVDLNVVNCTTIVLRLRYVWIVLSPTVAMSGATSLFLVCTCMFALGKYLLNVSYSSGTSPKVHAGG